MSKQLTVGSKILALDPLGFLIDNTQWNEGVANALAKLEGIQLTSNHFEILLMLRNFYEEYDFSPNQRAFVKYIKMKLGEEKGNSIYLLSLFPGSPAKIAAKIAGLPKPAHCF